VLKNATRLGAVAEVGSGEHETAGVTARPDSTQ
jgi:hypothetical protein